MLTLYSSFIQPHLEYAAAAWDPFLKKDIDLLEDVQRYTLKVCTKSWSLSYDELLTKSHLPSLQTRRRQFKLCHILKFFPQAPLCSKVFNYSSRSVHNQALVPVQAQTSQFQDSFFPSAIEEWNSLPESVTSASSIMAQFQIQLKVPV